MCIFSIAKRICCSELQENIFLLDTPRSDDDETTDEKETKQKRPATAPSKRLLSSSTPSGGRPRSARVDSIAPSINIMQDESENKENIAVNNNLVEKLIFLQNGLFITGIIVTVPVV